MQLRRFVFESCYMRLFRADDSPQSLDYIIIISSDVSDLHDHLGVSAEPRLILLSANSRCSG